MLTVSNLSKSFGNKKVLRGVTFSVNSGARTSLLGPNGSGKTTLFRILAGLDRPDVGSVSFTPSGVRLGYLPQGDFFLPDETIETFLARKQGDSADLERRFAQLAHQLALSPNDPDLQARYDDLLNRISFISQQTGDVQTIIADLGLGQIDPRTPTSILSGGQKTRLALAGVLTQRPDFLLLDEPTNHLDIHMLEWLEDYLVQSTASMLLVSHDRMFLDQICTHSLELDPLTHTVKEYAGNFSQYLDQKNAERSRQWQEYSDQQDEIQRLRSTAAHIRGIAQFRKGGKADTGDKFAKGFFANRGLETIRRAKSVEKRVEHLLTDEHIEKPGQTWRMKIDFSAPETGARLVFVAEDLAIGYPGCLLAQGIQVTMKHHQRVALIGPNGCGKTTFIKTVAGLLPPLSGTVKIGSGVHLGYMSQEQANLHPGDIPLTAVMRQMLSNETEVRSFLSKYLFKGDDVFTPVDSMSFGERARLSLAQLVASGCNFLLLDEPINHLDIPARASFEQALTQFAGTILAVVHDRYFINQFATAVWQIKNGQIQIIA